jgi:hypothetical protein
MDDMFRRAGEHYPLKGGDSYWDKISRKLTEELGPGQAQHTASGTQGIFRRKSTRLTVLLLLISLFISQEFRQSEGEVNGNAAAAKAQQENSAYARFNAAENSVEIAPMATGIQSEAPTGRRFGEIDKRISNGSDISFSPEAKTMMANSSLNENGRLMVSTRVDYKRSDAESLNVTASPSSSSRLKTNQQRQLEGLMADAGPDLIVEPYAGHVAAEKKLPGVQDNPAMRLPAIQRGFYGGIAGGLNISVVKHQQLSKPGASVGLLAGYAFNGRWSVESGLRFSRKNYYSDGDYFKMDNADSSMPSDMEVLSVEGASNVMEVPLRVIYNFAPKERGGYFATAGLNSFILTKESNEYLTLRNGTAGNMTAVYNDVHRYFAAALELGGGFEYSLKKRQKLRIETYLQFALKGIGVGNLPVSGAGIQIGYTLGR